MRFALRPIGFASLLVFAAAGLAGAESQIVQATYAPGPPPSITNTGAVQKTLGELEPGKDLVLEVTGTTLPGDLELKLNGVVEQPGSQVADKVSWTISQAKLAATPTLTLFTGGTQFFVQTLATVKEASPAAPSRAAMIAPPGGVCAGSPVQAAEIRKLTYDREGNLARVVFDAAGERLTALPPYIDANDEITFVIVAPKDHLAFYRVEVTSGTYSPQYLNVFLGAPVPDELKLQSTAAAAPPPVCAAKEFPVGRFTSSTVTAAIIYSNSTTTPASQFQTNQTLTIDPLYSGTVRIALVRTDLVDRSFGVGADGLIFNATEGDDEGTLILEYVPFVLTPRHWAGRDLLKPPRLWERVNLPVIGVGIEDPGENFFVGVELEFTKGLSVAGGLHYGKVDDLAGGLVPGDEFEGTAAELPLSSEWKTGAYVGVSVDLLIFSKAFQGLFSG